MTSVGEKSLIAGSVRVVEIFYAGLNPYIYTAKQTVDVFSRPGYMQKYAASFDVACNNRHAQRVPSDVRNGQFKFSGDPIHRSRDIRSRTKAGKSCCRGRSSEDENSLTFDYKFSVRKPNSAVIGFAVLEILSNI